MKEMLRRALRTFVQTAGAYIAANLVCATSGITDLGVLKTVLLGLAVSSAAGLAAVMNLPPKASGGEKDDDASLSDDESGDDGKDDGEDES